MALFPAGVASAEGQEPRGPEPSTVGGEVGLHGGQPFFRTHDDALRLYPELELTVEASGSSVPDDLPASARAEDGGARLAVRRARVGLGGELFGLVAFTAELELGGQRIGQTDYVGRRTPRWAPADAHDGVVRPGDLSVSFTPTRALSLTAGRQAVPFSMSNRTPDAATPFFERPLAIRGFVVPDRRGVGLTAWGETDARAFGYEVGLFSGDESGASLGQSAEVVGRVFTRPLGALGRGVLFELAQLGVSWRVGTNGASADTADRASLATEHGFVMWQPGRTDDRGGVMRVVASDRQSAIGGELRLPIRTPTNAVFDLQAEAYYVSDGTREVTRAFDTPDSVRLGGLEGVGWYASLTWWACFIPGFDQLVSGEPGITRPRSLDDARTPALASGLDASVLVGGVNATYDPAARGGAAQGVSPERIAIYEVGATVSYRLGANVRAGLGYTAYVAPDSGDTATTGVVVPDDLRRIDGSVGSGHATHELGFRVSGGF